MIKKHGGIFGRNPTFDAVTVDGGNVVIGTSGAGVDFSSNAHAAGMTSELLDDYEEGTWTPIVSATAGAITSITDASGTYLKIGRLVHLNGYFVVADNGTGSGLLKVTGLPYANSSLASIGSGREMLLTGNLLYSFLDASTSNFYFQKYDGSYPAASGYGIAFSLSYQV